MEQYYKNNLKIEIQRIEKKLPKHKIRRLTLFAKSFSNNGNGIKELFLENSNKVNGIHFSLNTSIDKDKIFNFIVAYLCIIQNLPIFLIDKTWRSYKVGEYEVSVN